MSLVGYAYYKHKINQEKISSKASINYREIQRKKLQINNTDSSVLEFIEGGLSREKTDFARDLEKKLYCAGWKISRSVFHLIEISVSLGFVCFSYLWLTMPFVILSIFSGPIICRGILNFIVERKAKTFEVEFGQFIMSLVSLLKTGMTPIIAMENAGKALEENSPVRLEVESLIEALRNGMDEERALSRFGDTVYSPTIETFVQILLVGKKFGGSFADSLERLAALVRKRLAFKMEAKASVAQAKMSMWVVFGAFAFGLGLLFFVMDEFRQAISEGFGRTLFHFVIVVSIVALLMFQKIVKIRL
ncbi:MAG: type II secretion system F family protein [Deltaproteobacteria bacterium]|nr:type II secretion system F family protein [Deltaproteobacteria bacterium]